MADCSFAITAVTGTAGTRDVVGPDNAAIANGDLLLSFGLTLQGRMGHIEHQIGDLRVTQLNGVELLLGAV